MPVSTDRPRPWPFSISLKGIDEGGGRLDGGGGNDDNSTATTLEILGDCAHHTGQHRRAVSFYRRAAARRHVASASASASGGGGTAPSSENPLSVRTASEASLLFKISRSLSGLGNIVEASSVLESVRRSSPHRNLAMSMTLGDLYAASGRNREARLSYLDALRRNPYALEAVEMLAALGAGNPQTYHD